MAVFLYILFAIISFIALFPPNNKKIRILVYWTLYVVLAIVAGTRINSVDFDNYVDLYNQIIHGNNGIIEYSFVIISWLSYLLCNNYFFLFFIYALIGVYLKFYVIYKISDLWFLSIIIYLSNFFLLQEMGQIRVGVAAGFFLLSIPYIYNRNKYKFLLCFLCAFFFHYSSIIMLPLYFLSKKDCKRLLFFSIPLAYLISFFGFNIMDITIPIPDIQDKLDMYNSLQGSGIDWMDKINVFNLVFLVKVLIFYVMLWKYDLLKKTNKYFPVLLKIYCLSLFVFPTFSFFPVASFRMSEYYGVVEIIIYPLLIYTTKPPKYSIPIIIVIGLVLMLMSQKNLLIN